MFTIFKNSLFFLFFINLAACSYSPNLLKESYNNLASDLSEELKSSLNPSLQQSAIIDDYAKQLLQWHRYNKLPKYSLSLSKLATIVTQDDIPLSQLQTILNEIEGMPHFEQATHLTYKMLAVAKSLTHNQINQLERSLNNEYQQESLATKEQKYSSEVSDGIKAMFRFMGVSLSHEQTRRIKEEAKKFHDLRLYELQAEKLWNKQMIALLRQKENPHFESRFTQLWNTQEPKLTGKALLLEQQNKRAMANLMKQIIMSFEPEQKTNLSRQLTSMSHTFSEMVNE